MTDAAEIADPHSELPGPRVWVNDVMREQRNAIIVARDLKLNNNPPRKETTP